MDDGRTTIFDYWSLPELCRWVNDGAFDGGELSEGQRALRDWYGYWLRLMGEPAFARGETYGLNHANRENARFGRCAGESVSGHWLYAFVRYDRECGQAFLVVIWLNPYVEAEEVMVELPEAVSEWLGWEVPRQWEIGRMERNGVHVEML